MLFYSIIMGFHQFYDDLQAESALSANREFVGDAPYEPRQRTKKQRPNCQFETDGRWLVELERE